MQPLCIPRSARRTRHALLRGRLLLPHTAARVRAPPPPRRRALAGRLVVERPALPAARRRQHARGHHAAAHAASAHRDDRAARVLRRADARAVFGGRAAAALGAAGVCALRREAGS